MAAYVLAALFAVPLRKDFWGNFTAEVLGILMASLVAWVTYRRFRAERFADVLQFSYDGPFEELRQRGQALYSALQSGPAEVRTLLTDKFRTSVAVSVRKAERKAAFFGRFLTIEELAAIEDLCEASDVLSSLKSVHTEATIMHNAALCALNLYVHSSVVLRKSLDPDLVSKMQMTLRSWSDHWLAERAAARRAALETLTT